MKKLFFVMAAVAALLTSCSKDDTFGGPTRGKVTFEVSTPELATRYGEGTTATALQYAVYDMIEDATNGKLVDTGTATLSNKTANVSIDLVEGRKYTAIFWADAGENASPYNFDAANKTVSYKNLNDLKANQEAYDAFYAFVPQDDIKVGETVTVTLKRPFAQLRIETNDAERAKKLGVEVVKTGITVDAYTSFNLETGALIGDKQNITFAPTTKASASTTVGEVTYDLISMNYLLVNQKETVDVTLNFTDDVNGTEHSYIRKYSSIDVQRNYRTLVRGSILTDPTVFNVTVDQEFEKDDINEDATDESNKAIGVSNASELQAALNTAPDGTIIYFANDIESASAIVINEAKGNTQKEITIDGLNNKFTGMFKINGQSDNNNNAATYIKNINFETSSKKIDDATAFIWGGSSGSDAKWRYANNVTIENCSFTATGEAENVVAGVILYQNYGYVKMSNVTATGLHSLIQNSPSEGPIQIDGAKITNGKNGISLNKNVSGYIKNVTINTTGYGIRIANSETTTIDIELENVNITSEVPVAARNITDKVTSGNITFKGNNTLTSPDNNHYQVIITSSDDETKTEMPTGSYTLTGADEFKVFPRDYVDLSQAITGNISASGTAIFVDSSVEESELGTFLFEVDGQMQSMSGLVVNGASITAETGIECNADTSIYLEGATFNCNTALKIGAGNITIYAIGCDFIVPEGGKICEAATGQMLIKNCKINGEEATVEQIKELCTGGITNGIMSI